jgi:hypothetical protein
VHHTTQEADASEVFPTQPQSMGTSIGMRDSRVDAYISEANDFAKPILGVSLRYRGVQGGLQLRFPPQILIGYIKSKNWQYQE